MDAVFRLAGPADTGQVRSVLDDATAWLYARGITKQWPERFDADWVAKQVARGTTWLVSVNGVVAGTVAIESEDPLWPDGEPAAYVHRLAVRRTASGLGTRILDWIAQSAPRIRLDCVRSNERLRRYYEGRGFEHRGDVQFHTYWMSRYELATNSTSNPSSSTR
ncbi:GNAT family N-acetyltransferase [Kutzneria buriramensis]|uniref:Acetyltransferase (GNAT) family protein n=1 Tax=Kutzneria buriramensis TaxID=1045776 RepID=A0A3E0HZ61_9PSEU|nr:GNAT family N-acetyltransferase [Kutzneria buriramensis]REH51600.1 acetyltransferase (GNAT) family protein [Kutzneria buriramensis]